MYGTGSDAISFVSVGVSDSVGGSIDNVVMEPYSTPGAVPEPSTMLLLCIGLIGITGLRRK